MGLPPDAETALESALRSLWPGAELRRHPAGRGQCHPTDRASYALVPSGRAPRLLVPVGDGFVAHRALRRFSSAEALGDSARRSAAAAVTRVTRGAALRDRISVSGGSADTVARHLSDLLGVEVTFSLGVGDARVNRKPVLQLFDDRGRTLGFAKVGDSDLSRRDVSREAVHVRRLADVTWRNLEVPHVLHLSSWHGLVVLVLSALPTRPDLATRDRWRPPGRAMAELSTAFAEDACALEDLAWTVAQHRAALTLPDETTRRRLLTCLDALVSQAGGRTWSVGAWHGDWTPWNMSQSHSRTRLWDWERFETGVPAGLDRYHHVLNGATRRWGATPDVMDRALGAAGAGVRLREDYLLAEVYLLAVTVRYLVLAQTRLGAAITRRGTDTLTVLERRLGVG